MKIVDYNPHDDAGDKTYTLREAIPVIVNAAPDYYSGNLESINDRLNKLTEMVAILAEAVEHTLTDEKIRSLISYPLAIEENDNEDV